MPKCFAPVILRSASADSADQSRSEEVNGIGRVVFQPRRPTGPVRSFRLLQRQARTAYGD